MAPRRVRRVRLVAVQGAAIAVAAVFLVLGIAGFTPGLTADLDGLPWHGHHADGRTATVFGVFAVSVAHNLLHLGSGMAGLLLARTFGGARAYLIGGGLVYLGLWLYGLLDAAVRESLPLNASDDWLHFGVGLVMLILGLTLGATRVPTGADGEILVPE